MQRKSNLNKFVTSIVETYPIPKFVQFYVVYQFTCFDVTDCDHSHFGFNSRKPSTELGRSRF